MPNLPYLLDRTRPIGSQLSRGLFAGLAALMLGSATWLSTSAYAESVIATIGVGGNPDGVGVNPTTNRIYVTNNTTNNVSVIDGSSNSVITTIGVGVNPHPVGVNPTTNRVFVANTSDDTISVIDGASNGVIATVGVGSNPDGLGVNPTTNRVYVANQFDSSVSVIDGASDSVITAIGVGGFPQGVGVNPTTNRIYVTNGSDNSVSVIDGSSNSVIATVGVATNPRFVGVNPATNRIYVSDRSSQSESVIDGATNTVMTTVRVGSNPTGVGVSPTTNRIYVANSGGNSVSVIDGSNNSVIATIGVGGNPQGVGVNPATNRIYVTNNLNGSVSVIDDNPDTIPPTAKPTQSPAANPDGWNNTDVTVTWNWSDNPGGSGIDPAHCPTSTTSSGEGPLTLNATCTDLAGNTGTASYTVRVDKTAPSISAAPTTQPNTNGWYNANVAVHFTCNDALSGIPSGACPADQVLSTEGSAVSSAAQTVADAAGNISAPSNVVTVKIDKTAPVAKPTQTPAASASGWNASDVTVNWNWSDNSGGSGLDTSNCTTSSTSAGEGTLSLTASCKDLAGNTGTTSINLKVDKTAPVTIATPAPGTLPNGFPLITVTGTATVKDTTGATVGTDTFTCYDTRGLKVSLAATDTGSGVASLTYAATGEQTIASTTVAGSTAQPAITASGVTTLTYAATDVAGNHEVTHSENVIVGRGFACANPTPTFKMPKHGTLQLVGTATFGGRTFPFSDTIAF